MCKCSYLDDVMKVMSMLCDRKFPGKTRLLRGCRRLDSTPSWDTWKKRKSLQSGRMPKVHAIFKMKDKWDLGKFYGISILSIAEKVFAGILLNRIYEEDFQLEAKCGFHINWHDHLLWQIKDLWIERNMQHYIVFIDFTKPSTLIWEVLWKSL